MCRRTGKGSRPPLSCCSGCQYSYTAAWLFSLQNSTMINSLAQVGLGSHREGLQAALELLQGGSVLVQRRLAGGLHRVGAREWRLVLEQLVQDHAEAVHVHLRGFERSG